ncbi:unnamed protein product, partial [Durusdinium trenchii]
MMSFLEHMAGELRARRRQLNLDRSHKALLICDFASQHSSKKYRHLKEQWMLQHNADIITGDSEEVQIPGGWGAAGGPNDGFHQYWHQLCGAYHRLAV